MSSYKAQRKAGQEQIRKLGSFCESILQGKHGHEGEHNKGYRNTDNEGEREQVEAQLWLITEDKTREVGLDTKHKKCKTTKVKQEVTDDRVTPCEQRQRLCPNSGFARLKYAF